MFYDMFPSAYHRCARLQLDFYLFFRPLQLHMYNFYYIYIFYIFIKFFIFIFMNIIHADLSLSFLSQVKLIYELAEYHAHFSLTITEFDAKIQTTGLLHVVCMQANQIMFIAEARHKCGKW